MSYWDEVLADSPTVLLKMDEASGSLVDTQTGNNATVSGAAMTYRSTGPHATGIPYAVTFASGTLATVADSTDLDLGDGPFSIEFWLKRTSSVGADDYETAVLADSPTVLFPMDESSGNLTDVVGSKTGTASGSPTYGVAGPMASHTAIAFSGDDYFSVADHADLDLGNGPFSIEFWLRRSSITVGSYIFGKTNASFATPGYAVELRNGATFDDVRLQDGSTSSHCYNSAAEIDDTDWHHIVYTRALATTAIMYVDGSSVGVSTNAKTFSDNNLALVIGALYAGGSAYTGELAYLAFYKSVLTPTRVAAHYAARTGGGLADSTPIKKASGSTAPGYMVKWVSDLLRLTNGAGTVDVSTVTADTDPGWHHWVITRGVGASGSIFRDGIAIVSPPEIEGYGRYALDSLGTRTATVTDSATFLAAFAALGSTVDIMRFSGTVNIDLGAVVRTLTSRSNFLIDGTGANVTITNGCIFFDACDHFAVVNVRNRANWDPVEENVGDGFTNYGCHDYYYSHVSASHAIDEQISSTNGCYNFSFIDCLIGRGIDPVVTYGYLSYGYEVEWNGPGSFIRTAFINSDTRNPQIGYRGVSSSTTPDPRPITYDLVNRIVVNANWCLIATLGAKVNDTNPYDYNNSKAPSAINGGVIGSFPVADWAQVTALSPSAAVANAKTNCGCLPHDAYDIALLAEIP